jgi:tyrosyl-tRNA synthetase
MRLAREIIGMLYSEKEANSAEEVFKTIFQKRESPSDMQSYDIQKEEFLLDILVKTKLSSSRAEAKRLIEQKAVKLNDKIIEDVMFKLNKKDCPIVLKKGKRFFVKIV